MQPTDGTTPSVSVVMCTYNGARYLDEQMESVLAQDYPLLEVIVQDDGSSDDTIDILHRYARRDRRVHVFRNERRLGFNRNFHTAMLRARGDLIAIADQDDIWFPQKVRRQVEAIGTCDLCFSAYFRDATFSNHLSCKVCPAGRLEDLLFTNVIPGHTMLVRRSFVGHETAWNDDFYYDWWFLLMAHMGGGVARVDEALNWHRPHEASAIARLRQQRGGTRREAHASWHPYVFGWLDLARLRHEKRWQQFYRSLLTIIPAEKQPVAHALCAALLGRSGGTLRLCCLCLRHRRLVYPSKGEPDWKNRLRAFCYPAIYAYGNTTFRK